MTLFTGTVISLHVISFIVMGALLFEYRHIHKKRMVMLTSFKSPFIPHRIWERRLLMTLYTLMTLVITFATVVFYLHLLPLLT